MLYSPRGNMASTHCLETFSFLSWKYFSLLLHIFTDSFHPFQIHDTNMVFAHYNSQSFFFISSSILPKCLSLVFPVLPCSLMPSIRHFVFFNISLFVFQRKSIWLPYPIPLSCKQTLHARPPSHINSWNVCLLFLEVKTSDCTQWSSLDRLGWN